MTVSMRRGRSIPLYRRLAVGAGVGLLVFSIAGVRSAPADAAGEQPASVPGLDLTDSAVTVHGRGEFKDLAVTVNQTKDLVNQAIGVTWAGAKPTSFYGSAYFTNFLQVMQCWGDPVSTADTPADRVNDVPDNPGPPREQCAFGAGLGSSKLTDVGAALDYGRTPRTAGATVTTNAQDSVYSSAEGGLYGYIPFHAVDGKSVTSDFIPDPRQPTRLQWSNPYYDQNTTNEVPFATTYPDGTGELSFQANTSLESTGLGCGAPVGTASAKPRSCWLVLVPRGDKDVDGSPLPDANSLGSPLAEANWANRIAVPLDFKLVSTPCDIRAQERPVLGSELVQGAISSWAAKICEAGGASFAYTSLTDDRARTTLISGARGTETADLSFLSRPVDPASVPAETPITYAPVTVSGLTIGFVADRIGEGYEPGKQIPAINLTPRLVAKLLTYSYRNALPYALLDKTHTLATPAASEYGWLADNPETVFSDPEFQKYNPDLSRMKTTGAKFRGGLLVELNGSDAAYELWRWIDSDPDAHKWLAGTPDEWRMKVNPHYTTDADKSVGATPLQLPRADFPSSDPWCGYPGNIDDGKAPTAGADRVAPALCMVNVRPYTSSFLETAQDVLSQKWLIKDFWNSQATPPNWQNTHDGIAPPGFRNTMGITDSVSSARFGVVSAKLRNAAGSFVAPDSAGLLAGVEAMTASAVPDVLQPDPKAQAKGAYPLTMVTYAAVMPAALDAGACKDYAALLGYVAADGQHPGVAFGELPAGYVPLPDKLAVQTKRAAQTVAQCVHPAPAPAAEATSAPVPAIEAPAAEATSEPAPEASLKAPSDSGASGADTAAKAPDEPVAAEPTPATSPGPELLPATAAAYLAKTPDDPTTFGYAIPLGIGAGVLAAILAPALTSRRRWGLPWRR